MKELFVDHPNSVGETYSMHLVQACCFSGRMLLAALACLVHAVLPFLFVKTASRTVHDLYDRMVMNRSATVREGASIDASADAGAFQN